MRKQTRQGLKLYAQIHAPAPGIKQGLNSMRISKFDCKK